MPDNHYWLVDADFQATHERVLKERLLPITLACVVSAIEDRRHQSIGKRLEQADPCCNSWEKLRAIYDYLIAHKAPDADVDLSNMAIVPDEQGVLHRIGDAPFLPEPDAMRLLNGAGIAYVAHEIRESLEHVQLLERAGVRRLSLSVVIDLLADACSEPRNINDAPAWLSDVKRLKDIYRYFNNQHRAENLDESDLARLRALPFVLRQDGVLSASNGGSALLLPPLSIDAVSHAIDLPGGRSLVSEQVLDGESRGFLERVLDIEKLTDANYFSTYVLSRYGGDDLSDDQRLDLLRRIRDAYPRFKEQKDWTTINLVQVAPLVRCADEQYRRVDDAYLPCDALDTVFAHGYAIPHAVYGIEREGEPRRFHHVDSPWLSFFLELGLRRDPSARDLVRTVEQAVAMPPDLQGVAIIKRVYDVLSSNWQDYARYSDYLEPLRTRAWLPSSNRSEQWHVPIDLYAGNLRGLVYSQAPIVDAAPGTPDWVQFIGLNRSPKPEHLVGHLLHLSQEGLPVPPQMYLYMRNIPEGDLQRLHGRAVIYDSRGQRFWLPQHVFIGGHNDKFGGYRCYINAAEANEALPTYVRLGVREDQPTTADYLDVLIEIADAFRGEPIGDSEQRIIEAAFVYLSGLLPGQTDDPPWLMTLRDLPIIPDQDGRLQRSNRIFLKDQDSLLSKFPAGDVRYVHYSDERARPLLSRMGVRPLSRAVERRPIQIGDSSHNAEWTTRLRFLTKAFQRIKLTYESQFPGGWSEIAGFQQSTVQTARDIRVRFVIQSGPTLVEGKEESQEVFYNIRSKTLYLRASQSPSSIPPSELLAEEIATMLNPTIDPGMLVSLLARILDAPLSEVDAILTRCKIAQPDKSDVPTYAPATTDGGYLPFDPVDVDEEWPSDGEESSEPEASTEEPLSSAPGLLTVSQPPLQEPSQPAMASLEFNVETTDDVTAEPDASEIAWSSDPGEDVVTSEALTSGGTNGRTGRHESNMRNDGAAPPRPHRSPLPHRVERPVDGGVPFIGSITPTVPRISTNWGRLYRDYGIRPSEATQASDEMDEFVQQSAFDAGIDTPIDESRDDERVSTVRFVLSFMNRYEGFLPLTRRAELMMRGQNSEILCVTDFGNQFPLFIDWDQQVLHNHEALPAFFAAHDIPAGGIVYLEHVFENEFRLYFRPAMQTLKAVRIMELQPDGSVAYFEIPRVELPCETVEHVFRADKRLEDPRALFMEAIGKKSVLETIIAVFENSLEATIHEVDLWMQVSLIRSVTRYAVLGELQRRSFFVNHGNGRWSFDPERQSDNGVYGHRSSLVHVSEHYRSLPGSGGGFVAGSWSSSSGFDWVASQPQPPQHEALYDPAATLKSLVGQIVDELRSMAGHPGISEALAPLAEFIQPLSATASVSEASDSGSHVANDLATLPEVAAASISRLLENPHDASAGQILAEEIRRCLDAVSEISVDDLTLVGMLTLAGSVVRELYLDSVLLEASHEAETAGSFDRAAMLLMLLARVSGRSEQERLEQLQRRGDAAEYLQLADNAETPFDALEYIAEALRVAFDYPDARDSYSRTAKTELAALFSDVQNAVEQHDPLRAAAALDRTRCALELHQPWIAGDLSQARSQMKRATQRVLLIVDEAAGTETEPEQTIACSDIVTAMYIRLDPSERRQYGFQYLNALLRLGTHAMAQADSARAIALLHVAVTNGRHAGGWHNFMTAPRRLATAYEQVGDWKSAWNCWKDLRDATSAADERRLAQDQRFIAQGRIRDEPLSISAARDHLHTELQMLSGDESLMKLILPLNLEALLKSLK